MPIISLVISKACAGGNDRQPCLRPLCCHSKIYFVTVCLSSPTLAETFVDSGLLCGLFELWPVDNSWPGVSQNVCVLREGTWALLVGEAGVDACR